MIGDKFVLINKSRLCDVHFTAEPRILIFSWGCCTCRLLHRRRCRASSLTACSPLKERSAPPLKNITSPAAADNEHRVGSFTDKCPSALTAQCVPSFLFATRKWRNRSTSALHSPSPALPSCISPACCCTAGVLSVLGSTTSAVPLY